MNRSTIIALALFGVSLILAVRLNALQDQHKELLNQVIDLSQLVGDMGTELDNLEDKLHVDKESIQN